MNPYEGYFRSVINDAGKNKFENLLFAQIRQHGLSEPTREFQFHPERRWRFDFAYPARHLAVEVEGGTWANGRHTRGYGFEADCVKYNEAALAGWCVIRVTPKMVTDLRAVKFIERALTNGQSEQG